MAPADSRCLKKGRRRDEARLEKAHRATHVVLLWMTGKLHLQICANLEVVPVGFKLSIDNQRISENAGQSAVGNGLGESGVSQIGLKLSHTILGMDGSSPVRWLTCGAVSRAHLLI